MKSLLFSKNNLFLLSIILISGIFISPKWNLAIIPWLHYIVALRFFRNNNWKGFLIAIPVFTVAAVVAQYKVFPMDVFSLAMFMLVANTIGLLPFIIDKIGYKKLPAFAATLLFPVVHTLFNFFMDQGPQGTWSNNAYSQYSFTALIQVAAVTGIYGINFMIFWFASTINYIFEKKANEEKVSYAAFAMPSVFLLVIGFGIYNLNTESPIKSTTSVSTITIEDNQVTESMYLGSTGKALQMPKSISQSDPIIQEFNKGMADFMKNHSEDRFQNVFTAMDNVLDRYLQASAAEVKKGAKIITWSEASIINIKDREKQYETIVSDFAKENNVYLLFPTAVFHPEKVATEKLFIENKVLTFDPTGELVNTYFKNIPVMGVEPSFPGDGTIPVIETEFGNLSPIICYDADHPQLIEQVSNSGTDILVVPTGDWKAISPYHTYMAAFRCIENGVSMIKATSNGLSAMIDDKGRILASYDYFDDNEIKSINYEIPVRSSKTLYSAASPIFLIGLQLIFLTYLLIGLITIIRSKIGQRKKILTYA